MRRGEKVTPITETASLFRRAPVLARVVLYSQASPGERATLKSLEAHYQRHNRESLKGELKWQI